MHVPLGGSTGDGNNQHQRNVNSKWERRKLRKNAGRRRLDQHNQDHKQTKREIRDKVIDNAYYIESTNIVSQLHDDLQHQQHHNTDDNDGLNYMLSGIRGDHHHDNTVKAKNAFANQADSDSYENDDNRIDGNTSNDNGKSNGNGNGIGIGSSNGNTGTMRVTFKLKNGKIAHKIALQRTQYTNTGRRKTPSNVKLNRNDKDSSAESSHSSSSNSGVYTGNDHGHDKMAMTGQIKSNEDDGTNGRHASNGLTDSDSTLNVDAIANVEDTDGLDTKATIDHDDNESFSGTKNQLHRFKRKSGKAAGALGRPKSSDSGSKSTSRKKEGGKWNHEMERANAITICWLTFQSLHAAVRYGPPGK